MKLYQPTHVFCQQKALISKGLRPRKTVTLVLGESAKGPDLKGIKTIFSLQNALGTMSAKGPDLKGIKTESAVCACCKHAGQQKALISKGLRQNFGNGLAHITDVSKRP